MPADRQSTGFFFTEKSIYNRFIALQGFFGSFCRYDATEILVIVAKNLSLVYSLFMVREKDRLTSTMGDTSVYAVSPFNFSNLDM